ncbi:response regulator [Burkholderiaceae bacterium DAT-1]|nr:response regulator [Burkholderiaceae bacterium DAT-1]
MQIMHEPKPDTSQPRAGVSDLQAYTDRILASMLRNELGWASRLLLAILFSGFALLIRISIAPVNAGLQFVTFFPTVALIAMFLGPLAGLWSTACCVSLSVLFLFPPYAELSFAWNGHTFIAASVFVADGIIISIAIGSMHRYFNMYKKTILDLEQTISKKTDIENELKYQHLALNAHAIVAETDAAGTIQYANELFCEISGYARHELIGQNHRLINSGIHPKSFFVDMYATIARGKIWRGDICNRKKDGSHYWVATTIIPFVGISGKPIRYIAIRTDITEQRLAEAHARQAAEAKSVFLANMSHEIRTPMNAILGLTRQAMEQIRDPALNALLSRIDRSGQLLIGIINDILDFSRIEAGRMPIESIPLSVEIVVRDVIELFLHTADAKQLNVYVDIHPDVPLHILGDPLRIRQILNNLVGNAIKFTETGDICLRVFRSSLADGQAGLIFSVEDTGIGIAPSQIEHLFEPFTQADGSITRKHGGSGLGLSISRRLADLMGGSLTLQSEPGNGTTARLAVVCKAAPPLVSFREIPQHATQTASPPVLWIPSPDSRTNLGITTLLDSWQITYQTLANPQDIFEWLNAYPGEHDLAILHGADTGNLKQIRAIRPSAHFIILCRTSNKRTLARDLASFHPTVLSYPVLPQALWQALQATPSIDDVAPAQEEARPRMRPLDGLRILLVEDNDLNREVALHFLQRRGALVRDCESGEQALSALDRHPFDLVVLDLHMPGMSGIETCMVIRTRYTRHIPVLAMTAAVMPEDQQRCWAAGMDGFIAKPFDPDDVIRQILHAVQRAGTSSGRPIPSTEILPIFDKAGALARLDGDEQLLSTLCQRFAERLTILLGLPPSIATLQDATLIHTLKGNAANLGCMALAQAAGSFLQTLNAPAEQGAQHRARSAFREQMSQALLALYDMARPKSTDPSTLPIHRHPAILLSQLNQSLLSHELLADNLLNEIRAYAAHDQTPTLAWQCLMRHVDALDFDAAQSCVTELLKQVTEA